MEPSLDTTMCDLFQDTSRRIADDLALELAGRESLTWRDYAGLVRELAPGFMALGLRHGERVALMTDNNPEFHIVDMAIMHAGGVPFSIHHADPVDRLRDALDVSGATMIVADAAYMETATLLSDLCPTVSTVITATAAPSLGEEITLYDVKRAAAADIDFDAVWKAIVPSDIATLIFTSGTTGRPKAVQLSHRALSICLRNTMNVVPVGENGRLLSYLPLTHIAERFMSYYTAVAYGVSIICVVDPDTLYDEIERVRPTRFFGVPRVYDKLLARVQAAIAGNSTLQKALDDGVALIGHEQSGQTLTEAQSAKQKSVFAAFAPVRESLGLDIAEYRGVATAPSSVGMLQIFAAIGLPVVDIWGMSEAVMCTMNPPSRIRLGTVGKFLQDVEGVIAPDGELLVRGPNTFSGYLGDPERTREIQDDEGWLHTGDLGAIDDDGYLTIVGRKKEMLITATGKNVAPSVIEYALKESSSLIDHVVAVADGRRYVTALISLDPDQLVAFASSNGIRGTYADLADHEAVAAEIARAVAKGNERLSKPESVRAWKIMDSEWKPGGDELTMTMKLRRESIAKKYAGEIDSLYV